MEDNSESAPPIPDQPGLGELVGRGVGKTNALVGGGIAIVVGIVASTLLVDKSVPAVVFTLSVVALLFTLWSLLNALLCSVQSHRDLHAFTRGERQRFEDAERSHQRERERLLEGGAPPEVLFVVRSYAPYLGARCVLIVRWPVAAAMPMGAQVSVAQSTETHERPLGVGCVRPRQQDGNCVITLDTVIPGQDEAVAELLKLDGQAGRVKNIRIGPVYDLQGVGSGASTSSSGNAGPPPLLTETGAR